MSLIGKQIEEFSAQAYNAKTDEFIEVSHEDLKGNWSVVVFYPADFSFVCPTELQDVQNQYAKLQELGVNAVSYTHLTLPTIIPECRSRWSPYH